jgi:LPPG:FO 2-phospho-L-lactate transferase
VGAARFLDGLARILPPERLFIVGNVGDDAEIHDLHISPDLDTVVYTLAGLAHRENGWGIQGDTFRCLEALGKLGADTWFQLGDRDLATNLYRTNLLRAGVPLSEVTARITAALGVRAAVVPATDQRLRTMVATAAGELDFQTYFVRRRSRDTVRGLGFAGARQARPAPGILEAIQHAAAIVLCPSNPFISIGPILAVPGIRDALRRTSAPIAAISPIVGGKAMKGPAARMMRSLGKPVSAAGVAELYRDFVNVFILDQADARFASKVEALEMRPVVTDTVMRGLPEKKALARVTLEALGLR